MLVPVRLEDVKFNSGHPVPRELVEDIARHAQISVSKLTKRAYCSNRRGGRLKLGPTRLAVLQWIANEFKWRWRQSVTVWKPDTDPAISQGMGVVSYVACVCSSSLLSWTLPCLSSCVPTVIGCSVLEGARGRHWRE
jgi:hypothetical protein